MLKTSFELIKELQSNYKAPKNKLHALEKQKKLFKVIKGLYETDNSVSPFLLSAAIYGPSYISVYWRQFKTCLMEQRFFLFCYKL